MAADPCLSQNVQTRVQRASCVTSDHPARSTPTRSLAGRLKDPRHFGDILIKGQFPTAVSSCLRDVALYRLGALSLRHHSVRMR